MVARRSTREPGAAHEPPAPPVEHDVADVGASRDAHAVADDEDPVAHSLAVAVPPVPADGARGREPPDEARTEHASSRRGLEDVDARATCRTAAQAEAEPASGAFHRHGAESGRRGAAARIGKPIRVGAAAERRRHERVRIAGLHPHPEDRHPWQVGAEGRPRAPGEARGDEPAHRRGHHELLAAHQEAQGRRVGQVAREVGEGLPRVGRPEDVAGADLARVVTQGTGRREVARVPADGHVDRPGVGGIDRDPGHGALRQAASGCDVPAGGRPALGAAEPPTFVAIPEANGAPSFTGSQ